MEENKSGLLKIAKLAPPLTEDEAFDKAHNAVQDYLSMIKMDEEKIDEFNSIVDSFCFDAKKGK
jgi:hypothetical protein